MKDCWYLRQPSMANNLGKTSVCLNSHFQRFLSFKSEIGEPFDILYRESGRRLWVDDAPTLGVLSEPEERPCFDT